MQIRLIILDFDGTLGDTASVIIKTMHETIREMGLPTRTDAECAAMIGLRLVEIPPVLFPECEIDVDLYADTYRRLFDVHNKDGAVKLYPHVIETLKALKARGLTLTIASSRGQTSLSQFVKNLGLTEIITYILGAGDVENGKPHPEAIFKTLDKYGFTETESILNEWNYVKDWEERFVESLKILKTYKNEILINSCFVGICVDRYCTDLHCYRKNRCKVQWQADVPHRAVCRC